MNKNNVIIGALVALLGLIVLINPTDSIRVVVVLIGIAAIINGIYEFVKIRSLSNDSAFRTTVTVRSACSIVLGLVAVILPFALFSAVTSIIRILLYIEAVYLLVSAVTQLFTWTRLKSFGVSIPGMGIEIVVTVVVAVVLLMLPADFGVKIVRVLGAVILAVGVLYAFYSWKNKAYVVTPENVHDADEKTDATSSGSDDSAAK